MLHTQHESLWRKLKENQRIKEKRMNRELLQHENFAADHTIDGTTGSLGDKTNAEFITMKRKPTFAPKTYTRNILRGNTP